LPRRCARGGPIAQVTVAKWRVDLWRANARYVMSGG